MCVRVHMWVCVYSAGRQTDRCTDGQADCVNKFSAYTLCIQIHRQAWVNLVRLKYFRPDWNLSFVSNISEFFFKSQFQNQDTEAVYILKT